MKIVHLLVLAAFCFIQSFAQNGYPTPPKTPNQLFYIQHSNNYNTYVYEANIRAGKIDASKPINEYRIVYTEGAVKKPLTSIQKKMAYGMTLLANSSQLYEFRLAATDKIHFFLTTSKGDHPKMYVVINQRKLNIEKLFVQLEEGFLNTSTEAKYVLFYGRDYESGEAVVEKLKLD